MLLIIILQKQLSLFSKVTPGTICITYMFQRFMCKYTRKLLSYLPNFCIIIWSIVFYKDTWSGSQYFLRISMQQDKGISLLEAQQNVACVFLLSEYDSLKVSSLETAVNDVVFISLMWYMHGMSLNLSQQPYLPLHVHVPLFIPACSKCHKSFAFAASQVAVCCLQQVVTQGILQFTQTTAARQSNPQAWFCVFLLFISIHHIKKNLLP